MSTPLFLVENEMEDVLKFYWKPVNKKRFSNNTAVAHFEAFFFFIPLISPLGCKLLRL